MKGQRDTLRKILDLEPRSLEMATWKMKEKIDALVERVIAGHWMGKVVIMMKDSPDCDPYFILQKTFKHYDMSFKVHHQGGYFQLLVDRRVLSEDHYYTEYAAKRILSTRTLGRLRDLCFIVTVKDEFEEITKESLLLATQNKKKKRPRHKHRKKTPKQITDSDSQSSGSVATEAARVCSSAAPVTTRIFRRSTAFPASLATIPEEKEPLEKRIRSRKNRRKKTKTSKGTPEVTSQSSGSKTTTTTTSETAETTGAPVVPIVHEMGDAAPVTYASLPDGEETLKKPTRSKRRKKKVKTSKETPEVAGQVSEAKTATTVAGATETPVVTSAHTMGDAGDIIHATLPDGEETLKKRTRSKHRKKKAKTSTQTPEAAGQPSETKTATTVAPETTGATETSVVPSAHTMGDTADAIHATLPDGEETVKKSSRSKRREKKAKTGTDLEAIGATEATGSTDATVDTAGTGDIETTATTNGTGITEPTGYSEFPPALNFSWANLVRMITEATTGTLLVTNGNTGITATTRYCTITAALDLSWANVVRKIDDAAPGTQRLTTGDAATTAASGGTGTTATNEEIGTKAATAATGDIGTTTATAPHNLSWVEVVRKMDDVAPAKTGDAATTAASEDIGITAATRYCKITAARDLSWANVVRKVDDIASATPRVTTGDVASSAASGTAATSAASSDAATSAASSDAATSATSRDTGTTAAGEDGGTTAAPVRTWANVVRANDTAPTSLEPIPEVEKPVDPIRAKMMRHLRGKLKIFSKIHSLNKLALSGFTEEDVPDITRLAEKFNLKLKRSKDGKLIISTNVERMELVKKLLKMGGTQGVFTVHIPKRYYESYKRGR